MTRTKAVRCDTRQLAAAEVMRDCLAALAPKGDLLLAGDGAELVADAVRHAGARPVLWSRWYVPGLPAQPWRPDGSYSGACLRLPRSRGELDMMLQAVASVVVPDGFVCVYGGNDEGIRSTASRLAPVLDEVETIAARRHCRVLHGVRRAETPDLKGDLSDWRRVVPLDLGDGPRAWVSYPGLFAHDRLDDGTALLLEALPELRSAARVLDFACGSGVVAAAIAGRNPGIGIDLLDRDALALVAAKENVPGATPIHADGLPPRAGSPSWDAIVSNPPIHAGKNEDHRMLDRLIMEAPAALQPGGSLTLVVQRRVPIAKKLQAAFRNVVLLRETTRFSVFRASGARKA